MDQFYHRTYFSKKKFLKLFGGEIRIYDENRSRLLFFVKQKAFKLKEDITVYSDESMAQELLKINARSIVDFSDAYDVTDVYAGKKLGSIRRKGLKSMLRDYWEILDENERVFGKVVEDSGFKAFMRRFLSSFIPQAFRIEVDGEKAEANS